MIHYYDKEGEPLTVSAWVELFEDYGYKQVARDTVGETVISTVWLGLDHGIGGKRKLIFETMTFPSDGGEDRQWRYETLEEAIIGHAAVVAGVKELARERESKP